MKQRNLCGLVGILLLTSFAGQAANVGNNYVFVENQVDGEYFLATETTEPRFTGANMMTKYSSRQRSMGYMGTAAGGFPLNGFSDIWLEDAPFDMPFIGNRCMNNNSRCPPDGYLPASHINKKGAYRIARNGAGGESGSARGVFSNKAYEYFKSLPVGKTEVYKYHYCSTNTDYNPALGQTCVSVRGSSGSHTFTVGKSGHLLLESTNALQEIYIDSAGNPSIGLGSELCKVGVVGSQNGAICKLLTYKFTGKAFRRMRVNLRVDSTALGSANRNTVRMSPNGSTGWEDANATDAGAASFTDMITTNGNGLYVFISNTFLKQLISRGVNLADSRNFFTFQFTNGAAPQSGFYEFSPSNTIKLIPRDYSISIISKDFELNPKRKGKVGYKEPPLVFDYTVTTSGPKQANNITAQVSGPTQKIGGKAFCIFSSADSRLRVPFPAYLSYTDSNGKNVSTRTGCDNALISLNTARWMRTPWAVPSQNDGSFYRTDLSLSFPMNNSSSMWALDGQDWMGVVSATGEIKVTALWN